MSRTKEDVPKRGDMSRRLPRDLLLGIGAFALFVLVSLGFLVAVGSPGSGLGALRNALASIRGDAFDLTLMHTNDTWGYLSGCG